MVKKHLLFLFLQIKASVSFIPRFIICSIILAVTAGAVGICGTKLMNEDTSGVHVNVAVVLPENDTLLHLAFKIYAAMDSMSSIASFKTVAGSDEALTMVSDGTVSSAVILPEGFLDAVMEGTPVNPHIILPSDAGIETLIFSSILDAGSRSLAYSQAVTRALADLVESHDMGPVVLAESAAYSSDLTTHYSMARTEFYNIIRLSATGEASSTDYYFATAVVLLMLLSGMSVTGIFTVRASKINGISDTYTCFCQYAAASFLFIVLFGAITLIGGRLTVGSSFTVSFNGILSFLIMALSITAFTAFLCTAADSGLISTLLIFLSAVIMIYACGRIMPSVFLPETVARIGSYLPVKHWCSLCESAVYGRIYLPSAIYSVVSGIIFLSASIGIFHLKGRSA